MWCAHVDASVMQWPATLACLVHFEQTITRKDNLNRYDTRKFLQRSTRTRGFIQRFFCPLVIQALTHTRTCRSEMQTPHGVLAVFSITAEHKSTLNSYLAKTTAQVATA